MEAVKEKVKKQSKANEKGSSMTVNDGLEVQQAIQKMLQTSTNLKGKYVRVFLSNLESLDPVLSPIMAKQNDLVDKYVEKDEKGDPKRGAVGFSFNNDDDQQKFEAETKNNWSTPMVDVKFFQMSIEDFDEMPIDTSKNDSMFLILKYLVRQS